MHSIFHLLRFVKTSLFCSFIFAICLCCGSCAVDSGSAPDADTPKISSISQDVATLINLPKELSVGVEISDKGELSYQWYSADSKLSSGTAVSGANGKTYTPETRAVGVFYYYCVITNKLGSSRRSVTSPRITYAVNEKLNAVAPVIISQPGNLSCEFGDNFAFSVAAYSADGGNLSYQWYFCATEDGEAKALEEAVKSSFAGKVSADSLGYYWCVVTDTIEDNGDGGEKSTQTQTNKVILSNNVVNANVPVLTTHPADVSAIIPAERTFSVGAYSADGGELSYQWYRILEGETEGTLIEDAVSEKYKAAANQVGKTCYYCVITNTIEDNGDGGTKTVSVKSDTAWFEAVYLKDVVPAPHFTKQPAVMNIAPYNQSVTLSCEAESSGYSVSYKWYESSDGTTATGTVIENATGKTFETPVFTERGIHYYYCVMTVLLGNGDGDDVNTMALISDVVSVAYTALPLVQIETVNGATPTPAKEKHNGRLKIYYPNGKIYDSGASNDFSIKVRGNATAGYPKRPYKLKLPKKINLLDIDSSENKDKNWVLLAGYCDKTLLCSKIGFYTASLFNELEGNEQLYVPNSEFVDVILNGEYLGNYCLTDSVKEGSERVPVNEKNTNEGGIGFVAEWDGNYYALEPKWFKSRFLYCPYTFKFPDTDDADFDSYMTYFEENINRFEEALYDENSEEDWKDYIDIESFARWFLIHNILANIDTNYFFSKKNSDNSSKLIMGPLWDFEWSIGIGCYDGARPRPANYWCVNGWYFTKLLTKIEFVTELKNQWSTLKTVHPDLAGLINSKMDEFAEEIDISQKINFKKWDILNQLVSVGGIPLGTYEAELECDKQFIENRIIWLDAAISAL